MANNSVLLFAMQSYGKFVKYQCIIKRYATILSDIAPKLYSKYEKDYFIGKKREEKTGAFLLQNLSYFWPENLDFQL